LSNSTTTIGKSAINSPDALKAVHILDKRQHIRRVGLAFWPCAVIGGGLMVWFGGGREIVGARFSQPKTASPEPEKK